MPQLKLNYTCPRCRTVLDRKRGDKLKDGLGNTFEDCPKCGLRTKTVDPKDNTLWPYKGVD